MVSCGGEGRQVEARGSSRLVDEICVLARQREPEPRRILAGLDHRPAPLRLVGERGHGEDVEGGLAPEAERVGEGERLAEECNRPDERRVRDELGGRSLVPLREPDEEWLRPALAALVGFVKRGGAKRLAVERFDGEPVTDTLVMPLLVDAGFLAGPRRAVLRA